MERLRTRGSLGDKGRSPALCHQGARREADSGQCWKMTENFTSVAILGSTDSRSSTDPKQDKPKRPISRHITVTLLKNKDNEKIP